MSTTRLEVDAEVRALCEAGEYDEATTRAIRAYGREVLGFLCAFHRVEADASEVFSIFAEELWRSLETFAWSCSLRTWVYTLARRASFKIVKTRRRAAREIGASGLSEVVQAVRTETLTYLRTETKDRVRALREALSKEDQALLVLRVDRGLAWDELARVLSDEDADADALKREGARVRKRFQLIKEKLKGLARAQGLLPRDDD